MTAETDIHWEKFSRKIQVPVLEKTQSERQAKISCDCTEYFSYFYENFTEIRKKIRLLTVKFQMPALEFILAATLRSVSSAGTRIFRETFSPDNCFFFSSLLYFLEK